VDDTDIRAAGDRQSAAETHPVHRRDHRHRQFAPLHRHLLELVGIAVCPLGQRWLILARRAGEAGKIKPGAERPAFTAKHHHAQALHALQCAARFDDACEHFGVKRVHLVRAVKAHQRNAVFPQRNGNPVVCGH